MWQQAMIALLVASAALYVAWTFMSMRSRQTLLDRLAAGGILTGYAARHRSRMATPGCSNCSAADTTGKHSARR
jgi:hypothetical protein